MPYKSKVTAPSDSRFGVAIAILAAGKGTRLKSKHPKVLHEIVGKPLLRHVVDAAMQVVSPEQIFAIIGHEAERVRTALASTGINFILQREQRGTGHALITAQPELQKYQNVIVLSGDVPLIRAQTIQQLYDFHRKNKAAMSILTALPADATGYGRIVRSRGDDVAAIVEQNALKKTQLGIREINSGIYAFQTKSLLEQLAKLTADNPHHELYLTDVAGLLVKAKQKVKALAAGHSDEVLGVNTRVELARLDALLRAQKAAALMASGVTILRPETCLIDSEVEIKEDTIIEPFVQIFGNTKIGSDCRIGSFSVLRDSELADGIEVRPGCIITSARIEKGAILGPYSHVRPESHIGEHARVGNFVEIKKSKLGKGSKANHLSYLGDTEIGDKVNVGAGTITCNYDGVNKFATVIENGAFIGSDATLVAPVRVGAGAYIAAGSCITQDVPADALGIARGQQTNKLEWARKRREKRTSSTAE